MKYLSLFILVLLFVLGGLGFNGDFVVNAGILSGLFLLLYAYFQRGKIEFPKGFLWYFLFFTILLISISWSVSPGSSFIYIPLFFSAALFWLATFNLQKELSGQFYKVVLLVGLVFAGLFFFKYFSGTLGLSENSLYLNFTGNHNHIGDYWAVLLVCSLYFALKKKRWPWAFVLPGGYLLYYSLSRSAYIALLVGALYLFFKGGWYQKTKRLFWTLSGLILLLFIFAGTIKPTFQERPYFIQGIVGFIKNPLGIGVNNFITISSNVDNQLFGAKLVSYYSHNLLLEFLDGIGIFALAFILFLIQSGKEMFKARGESLLYWAMFVTLLTNFMFDTTYIIPTMLWLMFASLGFAQREKENGINLAKIIKKAKKNKFIVNFLKH